MAEKKRFTREKIAPGVHFNTIFDDRFKTSRILIAMSSDIEEDKAAAITSLAGLLVHSTGKYPTFLELSRKLDSLYGMNISGSSGKHGENQMLYLSASGINDRYSLDGESVYEEMAKLLCGVLFDPNVRDGEFAPDDFNQEKRQLLDAIDAQFNDKRAYAKKRFLETMCSEEKYGVNLCGTKESVEALTSKMVYEQYRELVKTAKTEILCLCSNDTENVKRIFTENFEKVERDVKENETLVVRCAEDVTEKTDVEDVVQSKLMLGFRTDCAEPEEDVDAMKLMCTVLGGTAHSKLFNNVREKQSLCYYCVSGVDSTKGIMTVESGVEKENIEKTKAAILKEVEDMKNGVITEEEIESAKLSLANACITSTDLSSGTQSWYLTQILKGTCYTPEEQAQRYSAITKDEIVRAAKKLTLDTVYVLTGSGEDGEGE